MCVGGAGGARGPRPFPARASDVIDLPARPAMASAPRGGSSANRIDEPRFGPGAGGCDLGRGIRPLHVIPVPVLPAKRPRPPARP